MIRMILGFCLILIAFDQPEFFNAVFSDVLGHEVSNAVGFVMALFHVVVGLVLFGVGYLSYSRRSWR